LAGPKPFFSALIGKAVSHVWRGYGSAVFIEFGQLAPGRIRRDGEEGNSQGELTLMIEWGWRVERKNSILGGSWSSEKKWSGIFKKLIDTKVTNVETFGHLPEIAVTLSNDLRILSFMTAEGQPDWALIAKNPNIGSLRVKRGRLSIEQA
jgi:hypothetical protein